VSRITSPPRVRHHLSKDMRLVALHRTKIVGELAVLQAVVSSAIEKMLGHLPSVSFRVEVLSELATEF
jgi:hypothetical protein